MDGAVQRFRPRSPYSKLLYLCHCSTLSGHLEKRKIDDTMRRYFYCPCMANDFYETVRNYCSFAKNWQADIRQCKGRPFPPNEPLGFVLIDSLGLFPRTKSENQFVTVIRDRFPKLIKVVLTSRTTATFRARDLRNTT